MRLSIRNLIVLAVASVLLSLPLAYVLLAERSPATALAPIEVIAQYLQASYARDFNNTYPYISARDRSLKDERSYVRERGAFKGFSLQVAKKLARYIEVYPVEVRMTRDQANVRVKMKLPDANKLSPLLMGWDNDRLEKLQTSERQKLIESLETLHQEGKLDMIEGEEAFELVNEAGHWRMFLNWAAGINIKFQTTLPSGAKIDAKLVQTKVVTRPGDLFNISLKIRNHSKRELTVRIGHLVEPHEVRDYLDLVECGFLLPVRLLPESEEEFTSTYLLRSGLPEGVRHLDVTYAFALQ